MRIYSSLLFATLILTELHPLIAKSLWNGPVCHRVQQEEVDKHHGTGEVQNITSIFISQITFGLLHTISTQHMLVKVGKRRSLGRSHLIRAGVSSLAMDVPT